MESGKSVWQGLARIVAAVVVASVALAGCDLGPLWGEDRLNRSQQREFLDALVAIDGVSDAELEYVPSGLSKNLWVLVYVEDGEIDEETFSAVLQAFVDVSGEGSNESVEIRFVSDVLYESVVLGMTSDQVSVVELADEFGLGSPAFHAVEGTAAEFTAALGLRE